LLVGLARLAALLAWLLLAGLLLAFLALLLLLAGGLALGIVLLLLRIPLVLTTHGVLLFTERAVIGACQVNWRDSGLFRPIARAPESG
jgi:fatty acid desaturase